MSRPVAADVALLDRYRTEMTIIREHRPNVLLEGPSAATEAMLCLLRPHLVEAIVWTGPATRLDRLGDGARVLILRDADALRVDDQRRLLEWLSGATSRTQIISTSERPLFARVTEGLFDAVLYYRLNVVLLRV